MMREIQQQIGAPRLEVMEADHEAVIHALVAAGVGIGLLRQELAEMGEARGELKRLRTCAATARLSFIHAVERQSDPAMVAVVSALRATWGLPDARPTRAPRTRPAPGPLPARSRARPPSRRAAEPLGQRARHHDMGDAGFHEFLAFHLEPVRFVETGGVRLRVQHQHAVPVAVPWPISASRICPPTPRPRALAHGHAADVAVGQQASGAHRRAVRIVGHRMHRHRVVVVELDLDRHALLDHEDLVAHAGRILAQAVPGSQSDAYA